MLGIDLKQDKRQERDLPNQPLATVLAALASPVGLLNSAEAVLTYSHRYSRKLDGVDQPGFATEAQVERETVRQQVAEKAPRPNNILTLLPAEKAKALERQTGESQAAVRPLRILVIDDVPDISQILSALLGCLGHQVITAASGPEGIAKAKEFHPEVLLCDIGMPGMNGYEVAERMRKDDELQGIYPIAISGYAQPDDLQRSKAAGFKRHLAKPVDLDTLIITLAEVS